MLAVDTNVLIRVMIQDDANQYKAAAATIEEGGWVSNVVLVEAMWVLKQIYDRSPAQLALLIKSLLTHESLVLEDPDVVQDALAEFKRKPKLGFSDCLVLAIARAAGHTPLATFDKALAKLANTKLAR